MREACRPAATARHSSPKTARLPSAGGIRGVVDDKIVWLQMYCGAAPRRWRKRAQHQAAFARFASSEKPAHQHRATRVKVAQPNRAAAGIEEYNFRRSQERQSAPIAPKAAIVIRAITAWRLALIGYRPHLAMARKPLQKWLPSHEIIVKLSLKKRYIAASIHEVKTGDKRV